MPELTMSQFATKDHLYAAQRARIEQLKRQLEIATQLAGDGEALARRFHEAYERLAPSFGYETRQETRAFDPESDNGRLMIAVCAELQVIPLDPQFDQDVTLHQHLLHMLGAKDHEEAGRIIAQHHAREMQTVQPTEPIAEIISANHDDAEFGERAIKLLRDFNHLEYGTKLFAAPYPNQIVLSGHQLLSALRLANPSLDLDPSELESEVVISDSPLIDPMNNQPLCEGPIAWPDGVNESAIALEDEPEKSAHGPLPTPPAAQGLDAQPQAARDVIAERARQVHSKGYGQTRDDQYAAGELAAAAGVLALLCVESVSLQDVKPFWPWSIESLKPDHPRKMLTKAGALVLAELERLDRAAGSDA